MIARSAAAVVENQAHLAEGNDGLEPTVPFRVASRQLGPNAVGLCGADPCVDIRRFEASIVNGDAGCSISVGLAVLVGAVVPVVTGVLVRVAVAPITVAVAVNKGVAVAVGCAPEQ